MVFRLNLALDRPGGEKRSGITLHRAFPMLFAMKETQEWCVEMMARRVASYQARLFIRVLKKYADFDGRARRREYWIFNTCNAIVLMCLAGAADNLNAIALGYLLVIIVPSIAVAVRRMHDTNHSGWWVLCPVINLSLMCTRGTRGRNRYGRCAKTRQAQQRKTVKYSA